MKEFICICCPMGCMLKVDDSNPNDIQVSGNTCARGKAYGISELTNPVRMVTTSVEVEGGSQAVVSVKTKEPISKALIFDLLKEIACVKVKAPVKIGDVVMSNALNKGIEVIATANVERK